MKHLLGVSRDLLNQRQVADALRADLAQQLENLRPLTQSLIAASEHNIETLAPKRSAALTIYPSSKRTAHLNISRL